MVFSLLNLKYHFVLFLKINTRGKRYGESFLLKLPVTTVTLTGDEQETNALPPTVRLESARTCMWKPV